MTHRHVEDAVLVAVARRLATLAWLGHDQLVLVTDDVTRDRQRDRQRDRHTDTSRMLRY